MKLIKRQLLWVLVVVPLFPSCQPLEDPAKTIEDLLKRFTGLIDQVAVWNRALSAEEMAFLASPEVNVDIKPSSDPNCINPDGHGVIPVAILTTDTFDAATVDPFSVTLEGSTVRVKGKSGNAGSLEDVDADGDLDLVVQIMDDTLLAGKDTAILEGLTFGGLPIRGSDSICIVP